MSFAAHLFSSQPIKKEGVQKKHHLFHYKTNEIQRRTTFPDASIQNNEKMNKIVKFDFRCEENETEMWQSPPVSPVFY